MTSESSQDLSENEKVKSSSEPPEKKQQEEQRKHGSLAHQASYLIVGRLISFAFMFLLPVILTRFFTKAEFGLYRQFFLLNYAVYTILQLGFAYALPSIMPREKQHTRAILTNTMLFLTLLGIFTAFIGFILGNVPIPWLQEKEIYHLLPVLGVFTGLLIASSFFDNLLIIEERSQATAVLIISWDLGRGFALIATVLLTRSLHAALWAASLVCLIRYFALFLYLKKRYQIQLAMLQLDVFIRHLRLAIPMTVQSAAHLIEVNVDKYMVMFMFSTSAFAMYTVGVFQIPIVEMVFSSIANVVLPRLSELYGENNKQGMVDLWCEAMRKSALFMFPIFASVFLIHNELILFLFSQKYAESAPLFGIYIWIIPSYIIANGLLLHAMGHGRLLLIFGIVKPTFAIVLVYYGIHYWGLKGAISAIVLYHYIATFSYLYVSSWALKVSLRQLLPMRELFQILLITAASATLPFLLGQFKMPQLASLIVKPSLFFAFFAFFLLRSKLLTTSDRETIKKIVFKLIKPLQSILRRSKNGTSET